MADVKTPIIDMNFLSHYGLLVDPRNERFIVTTTQLSSKGYTVTDNAPSIETIFGDSHYYRLLAEFPGFARPPTIGKEKARHDVITHRNHARPASIQQTLSPRTWSTWTAKGRIPIHDRVKRVASIEKPVGITSACRAQKGWKPTTMWRQSCATRSHDTW